MPANPVFTEFLCRSDLRLDAVSASALGAQMWMVRLERDEFLFHQGDPCDHFYLVFDGVVDVQATSPEGQELLFTSLRTGAPIGEATVVAGEPRTASIRARTDATILAIERSRFLRLAHDHPDLSLALARLAAQTLRRLSTRVEQGAFADLDTRLIGLLHELAQPAGASHVDPSSAGQQSPNGRSTVEVDKSGRIQLRITQQALAKRLGVTRESVNKHLGRLANRGLIEVGRGRVTIIDANEFATAAAF